MHLKNQKGMSLIAVMIMGSLVAGMGIYIAKMSQVSNQVTTTAKNNLDLNTVTNTVTNALLKRSVCTELLKDQELGYEMDKLSAGGADLLEVDEPVPGSAYITKRIQFIQDSDNSQYFIAAHFEKKDGDKSVGGKTIARRFPVSVTFDGSKVSGCHSDESNAIDSAAELACEQIGGAMESASGTPKCVLLRETTESILKKAVESGELTVNIYKDSSGQMSLDSSSETKRVEGSGKCNCYGHPCPSGWVTLDTGCRRGSRSGSCGGSKKKYGWSDCRYDPELIGKMIKPEL